MTGDLLTSSQRRLRAAAVGLVVTLLVLGTGVFLGVSRAQQQDQRAGAASQSSIPLAAVASQPRIVFRNSAIGTKYGFVSMVPLSDPGGPRAFTTASCDRVFATTTETLCLASERGIATTYSAKVVTDDTGKARPIPLTGSPSRARLSSDGTLAATTSFVAGDSYAATNFSTRTVITHVASGDSQDLEDFRLIEQGQQIAPLDRNFWGVTFAADDDHFYLTVAFGGTTHLAEGSLSQRTVETVRADAECPSLSPDGTRVAYKKQGNRARGEWRLTVLDLTTGRETPLSETRSVDDQVEWLDNSRLLYGMPAEGTAAGESDVWVVNADGTGQPSIIVPKAWSPAVVR